MKFILNLTQVDKEDIDVAGAKAVSLGESLKIGLKIPQGFVITSEAFRNFISQNNLAESVKALAAELATGSASMRQEVFENLRKIILSQDFSTELATEIKKSVEKISAKDTLLLVSSSPNKRTSSESFGDTVVVNNEKEIASAIKKYWVDYFKEPADPLGLGGGVLIQEVIEPDLSGVIFTEDPEVKLPGRIIIKALWGEMNKKLLDGSADYYEITKQNFVIVENKITDQKEQIVSVKGAEKKIPLAKAYEGRQKLSDEEVLELAKIGKRIEDAYLYPQKIKWVKSDGKFFILGNETLDTTKTELNSPSEHFKIKLPVLARGTPVFPGFASGIAKFVLSEKDLRKVKVGDVVVINKFHPSYKDAFKKASAVATQNGLNASSESVASKLGKPWVGGVGKINFGDEHVVSVDGASGYIYRGALSKHHLSKLAAAYEEKRQVKDEEILMTATKVLVNLSDADQAARASKEAVDGVGLFRAENIVASVGVHPEKLLRDKRDKNESVLVNRLVGDLKIVCSAFAPRPVIYRTTDFKSSEYENLKGAAAYEGKEENPALGFRGAARFLSDKSSFGLELAALKEIRNKFELKNLWLCVPFVRTLKEGSKIIKAVAASGLHRSHSFKLLLIVEVPSNVILIEKFLDLGFDGVVIDLNDLTALTLGVDRDNQKLGSGYNDSDPAVFWSLEQVIRQCRRRKLYAEVFGQGLITYPSLLDSLIEWGVSSISVSADLAEQARKLVHKSEEKLVSARKHS